jgi:hypothetical protein
VYGFSLEEIINLAAFVFTITDHLSFQMEFWRRPEEISLSYRVKNEVLHRVKEERYIVRTITRRKAIWIGHILHRNCFLNKLLEER